MSGQLSRAEGEATSEERERGATEEGGNRTQTGGRGGAAARVKGAKRRARTRHGSCGRGQCGAGTRVKGASTPHGGHPTARRAGGRASRSRRGGGGITSCGQRGRRRWRAPAAAPGWAAGGCRCSPPACPGTRAAGGAGASVWAGVSGQRWWSGASAARKTSRDAGKWLAGCREARSQPARPRLG